LPNVQVQFKHNAILAVYEHLAEEFRKLFGEACNSSIIAQMMPKLFINELLGVLLVWGNKGSNHHEEEKRTGLLSIT
jgi:hypothetical protein